MIQHRDLLSEHDRAALAQHLQRGTREKNLTFAEWAWEFSSLGPNVRLRVVLAASLLAAPAALQHEDPDRFIAEELAELGLESALEALGDYPWGAPEHMAALDALEAKLHKLRLYIEETPGNVELVRKREAMYSAVGCAANALAASCWKKDMVSREFDPAEYQARVEAGPVEEISVCLSLACLAAGLDRQMLTEALAEHILR